MEFVCSVSRLSTESVGSRRKLVANCVHTADADATQLDSCVASASVVCIGLKCSLTLIPYLLYRPVESHSGARETIVVGPYPHSQRSRH